MNNKVILAVESLSKTYVGESYNVKALNHVSFQLDKGEMVAIMGTSGSGKSTLLNILGALDEPSSGSIWLSGVDMKDVFQEPLASQYRLANIGFVFQSFHLLKDLTVEENIRLPLILQQMSEEEIAKKVNEVMSLLGLIKWKKHRPMQLSGGQQQRVAIGRAMITAPPILLADEPTGNLDFNTSSDILRVLVHMKEYFQQSVLIVTHDPNVATYADRVLFFHDGEIVDEYICNDDEDLESILRKFKGIAGSKKDEINT